MIDQKHVVYAIEIELIESYKEGSLSICNALLLRSCLSMVVNHLTIEQQDFFVTKYGTQFATVFSNNT